MCADLGRSGFAIKGILRSPSRNSRESLWELGNTQSPCLTCLMIRVRGMALPSVSRRALVALAIEPFSLSTSIVGTAILLGSHLACFAVHGCNCNPRTLGTMILFFDVNQSLAHVYTFKPFGDGFRYESRRYTDRREYPLPPNLQVSCQ